MKLPITLHIVLDVPDGVTASVTPNLPAASVAPPSDAAAPTLPAPTLGTQWLPGACPKHGPDKWGPSKFGGSYCTARDDQRLKGYCILKSGMEWNGRVIP